MPVIPHHGIHPSIHPSVFVARGAYVIGDVRLEKDVSIWFNAVLRGDINAIRIGDRTNIQDGAVLHVTSELPVLIGADVTVGHHAVVHACTVAGVPARVVRPLTEDERAQLKASASHYVEYARSFVHVTHEGVNR